MCHLFHWDISNIFSLFFSNIVWISNNFMRLRQVNIKPKFFYPG